MKPWLLVARKRFQAKCLETVITQTNGVPSIADVSNRPSREIAQALLSKVGPVPSSTKKQAGQTSGNNFEIACQDFIAECFSKLSHLRPGSFSVERGQAISRFEQYRHLEQLKALADESSALRTHLGSDYLIKPDVIVCRQAETDETINTPMKLVDESVANHTSLRCANGATETLHASISCKVTIRSDRVQNTRSEALNLVRNRKGRLPHIVAVTAEPLPSRIAAIAMGTGDIDCVYHFALQELVETLQEQERETLELVETMIAGHRLRDIADLPLDLVI